MPLGSRRVRWPRLVEPHWATLRRYSPERAFEQIVAPQWKAFCAVRATHFPASGRTVRQILFVRKKSKPEPQGTTVHDLAALYEKE